MGFPSSIFCPELRCSKWVRHAFLITYEEMDSLWDVWKSHYLVSPIQKVRKENWRIKKEAFLSQYKQYLEHLETQETIPNAEQRKLFTLLLASSIEDLYAVSLQEEQFFVKAKRPVIQLQMYHAFFSQADHAIHPMAMHADSFSFGLQVSYPQIYEDPSSSQFIKVLQEKTLPSTALYQNTLQWIRKNTRPFHYLYKGEEKVAPFRVGKAKTDWILYHKQLHRLLDGAR